MNPTARKFATLMGSASLFTLANALSAQAQQVAQAQMAQATPTEVPEQVLVTGSLIHGAVAVGVPVTNLGTQDFTETGNVTIGDLFRTIPSANVSPGPSAVNSNGHQERETRVNIRGLDQTGPRTLLMVDGVRDELVEVGQNIGSYEGSEVDIVGMQKILAEAEGFVSVLVMITDKVTSVWMRVE